MGASKTDFYSDRQKAIASMAKSLGHPARIAIIEYLMKVDSCICGDIVNELPIAQPTVSQHLRELKQAGIIKGNVEGTSICYCIDEQTIHLLQEYFEAMSKKLKDKLSNCC